MRGNLLLQCTTESNRSASTRVLLECCVGGDIEQLIPLQPSCATHDFVDLFPVGYLFFRLTHPGLPSNPPVDALPYFPPFFLPFLESFLDLTYALRGLELYIGSKVDLDSGVLLSSALFPIALLITAKI